MADTPISGLVLRRSKNSFTDDKTGDLIEYFDALVFDPATKDLVLVRSGKAEGLAAFEPGTQITDALVEVVGLAKINVQKARPAGHVGANVPEYF